MNNIQLDDLAISYENNLYISRDFLGRGNCLYNS